MKTTLQALLLSCFCLTAVAEKNKTHIVVWAKDGTQVAYALADQPRITFTETDLVITSSGIEVNYTLENMARFTYEANENTAITNLQTDESPFNLDGESLLFHSLKANTTVSVYSLNGTLMLNKTVYKDGEYALPLSNLNAGVYIINENGITYKIVKK